MTKLTYEYVLKAIEHFQLVELVLYQRVPEVLKCYSVCLDCRVEF